MQCACVWTGDLYGREYVERLRKQLPNLLCVTDHDEQIPDVTMMKAPKGVKGWWVKPFFFSDVFKHPLLVVDLDMIFLKDVSAFEKTGAPYSLRDWTPTGARIRNINTSIMFLDRAYPWVWRDFLKNQAFIEKNWPTDQHWLWSLPLSWHHYPDNWAASYRRSVVTPETKVVVYHGRPKPHEVDWDPIRKIQYPDSPRV